MANGHRHKYSNSLVIKKVILARMKTDFFAYWFEKNLKNLIHEVEGEENEHFQSQLTGMLIARNFPYLDLEIFIRISEHIHVI